jgi:hypothetical protein
MTRAKERGAGQPSVLRHLRTPRTSRRIQIDVRLPQLEQRLQLQFQCSLADVAKEQLMKKSWLDPTDAPVHGT